MAKEDYEQVTATEAVELYLTEKENDGASPYTIRSHQSRLGYFEDWFGQETDYEWMYELGGIDTKRFKSWRFDDHAQATVSGQMDTLRVFLRFCAEIDAVHEELPDKVKSPNGGDQRSAEIDGEHAREILEHLDRYAYASFPHALFQFLWYSMARVGAARAVDLEHVDLDDGYAEFEHRPDEGTPLKNGEDSERTISLRRETCEILRDYISEHRTEVTDEHGREPLFVAPSGRTRPHTTTLRNRVYRLSQPCLLGDCPHDRVEDECRAAQSLNDACRCPSSESSHAVRRGSISWHLREETSKATVSERADVTPAVLDEHYSMLTEKEKADVRSEELPDGL